MLRQYSPHKKRRISAVITACTPTGYSGRLRITVAAWRTEAGGEMEVMSGGAGRETVQFKAPPAYTLPVQTDAFFIWFEAAPVGAMALARADGTSQRFYSFSAQIQRERKDYSDQLEATQKGPLGMTPWLSWFLGCLLRAVQRMRCVDLMPFCSRQARHGDGVAG